jgi:hypothetical protein
MIPRDSIGFCRIPYVSTGFWKFLQLSQDYIEFLKIFWDSRIQLDSTEFRKIPGFYSFRLVFSMCHKSSFNVYNLIRLDGIRYYISAWTERRRIRRVQNLWIQIRTQIIRLIPRRKSATPVFEVPVESHFFPLPLVLHITQILGSRFYPRAWY